MAAGRQRIEVKHPVTEGEKLTSDDLGGRAVILNEERQRFLAGRDDGKPLEVYEHVLNQASCDRAYCGMFLEVLDDGSAHFIGADLLPAPVPPVKRPVIEMERLAGGHLGAVVHPQGA